MKGSKDQKGQNEKFIISLDGRFPIKILNIFRNIKA